MPVQGPGSCPGRLGVSGNTRRLDDWPAWKALGALAGPDQAISGQCSQWTQVLDLTGCRWPYRRSGGQPGFWGEAGRRQVWMPARCLEPPRSFHAARRPGSPGLGGCMASCPGKAVWPPLSRARPHPGEQGSCPGRLGCASLDAEVAFGQGLRPRHLGLRGAGPRDWLGTAEPWGRGQGPTWARKADSRRLL